jgi:uncharacterized membrane protein YjjP (DUF1212 family)
MCVSGTGLDSRRIVIACINALIAGALSYTNHFCFYSVAAGSIVLSRSCFFPSRFRCPPDLRPLLSARNPSVLPGFIFLCGALELANRCLVSGQCRCTIPNAKRSV